MITAGKPSRSAAKPVMIMILAMRKNQGCCEIVRMAPATSCGICSRAKSQVNTEAPAMSHTLTALTIPLSRQRLGRRRKGVSR
jgi:hypothetical protein